MKMRTQLIGSYALILLLAGAGAAFLVQLIASELTSANSRSAAQAVSELAEFNLRLSEERLTTAGERLVALESRQVAALLSLMLGGSPAYDYTRLRNDPAVRKVAAGDISFDDRVVGYMDLFDRSGVAVIHLNRAIEGRDYREWADEFPDMWKLVQRSFTEDHVSGYYTFVDRNNRVVRKYMAITHVPDTPFNMCAVVNIDQFFVPVHRKIREEQERHEAHVQAAISRDTESALNQAYFVALYVVCGLMALLGVFAGWFSRSISQPILRLREGVRQIGDGNFVTQVAERGSEEVVELARSFNVLGSRLIEYTEELKRTTAEKQRIESELVIAAGIQQSLLPREFPPFPEHAELDIFATTRPAREVGGDCYDFFLLDERRLCFAICDVSGKGVPAAIFMAVTKSLIEVNARAESRPDIILRRVNSELNKNNDTCMFATVLLGVFNMETGHVVCANAGHEQPLLTRPGESPVEWTVPRGPALGLFEDELYTTGEHVMSRGQILLAYTDGVTEAWDKNDALYGEARLRETVAAGAYHDSQTLVEMVVHDVQRFSEDVPQSDDITVLAFRLTDPHEKP